MHSKAFLQACSPTEFFLWELLEWWGGRVAFVFCGLGAFEDMEKKVEYRRYFKLISDRKIVTSTVY